MSTDTPIYKCGVDIVALHKKTMEDLVKHVPIYKCGVDITRLKTHIIEEPKSITDNAIIKDDIYTSKTMKAKKMRKRVSTVGGGAEYEFNTLNINTDSPEYSSLYYLDCPEYNELTNRLYLVQVPMYETLVGKRANIDLPASEIGSGVDYDLSTELTDVMLPITKIAQMNFRGSVVKFDKNRDVKRVYKEIQRALDIKDELLIGDVGGYVIDDTLKTEFIYLVETIEANFSFMTDTIEEVRQDRLFVYRNSIGKTNKELLEEKSRQVDKIRTIHISDLDKWMP
jgi:hypothetical protein